MTRLTLTPLAEQDLESIADYIAADNPIRVVRFIKELRTHCQRIINNPSGYRRRPELGDDLRSCAHGSYVIFFTASPDEVTVIRILHAARDITTQLQQSDPS